MIAAMTNVSAVVKDRQQCQTNLVSLHAGNDNDNEHESDSCQMKLTEKDMEQASRLRMKESSMFPGPSARITRTLVIS